MKLLLVTLIWVTGLNFDVCFAQNSSLKLHSKVRTTFLEVFHGYSDLSIAQVKIPQWVNFVSFKISAESFDFSIFGCSPREVVLIAKHGSYPLLDPAKSGFPADFKNISRSHEFELHVWTNETVHYLNLTSPLSGFYYFSAFFPYVNPRKKSIKQKGLSEHCSAFVTIETSLQKINDFDILSSGKRYKLYSTSNESYYFEYFNTFTPTKVEIVIQNYKTLSKRDNVTIRINTFALPSNNSYISENIILNSLDNPTTLNYYLNREDVHYFQIQFNHKTDNSSQSIEFDFYSQTEKIKTSTNIITYDLVKESSSESFFSYYNMPHNNFLEPAPLNLSNTEMANLKLSIEDIIDIGGTLHFSLAFLSKKARKHYKLLPHTTESDQIVIGCISQDIYHVPMLPNLCFNEGKIYEAPIFINSSVQNKTIMVPYPESGNWYFSVQLFCKSCQPCDCSSECKKKMLNCIEECWNRCENSPRCMLCPDNCQKNANLSTCTSCRCINGCSITNQTCQNSIMYHVHSAPCVKGTCGKNGRCVNLLADGYVFTACACLNNYKGFDCSDGSDATPIWQLILEMLFLILSNAFMIPCILLAYRRKYYIESIVYASVLVFSALYHACDAGENIINICFSSLESLQYGDFFSALFAIFVTIVAIADIQNLTIKGIIHVAGAIILSYCVVLDKTSLWVFILAVIPGICLIVFSWISKYKSRHNFSFVSPLYWRLFLPLGIVVAIGGLILYVFCQTKANYLYIHSLWHICVAVSLLLVLPKVSTFQKDN